MPAFTAAQAFEMAMSIERNGEQFYNTVADKTTDPGLQALFRELAFQERRHHAAFQEMAGGLGEASGLALSEYDQYPLYLEAALSNALFSGPDKALALAEQAHDRRTALQAAIGFEKDTLLFFYDLMDMVDDAEREAVSRIIREEKAHLHRLTRAL